jgi:SAM-dependent methyltransferase
MNYDYRNINQRGWSHLALNGCDSSQPYGPQEFTQARKLLDHHNWIPWREIEHVLCLAASGGQQAPLFASLNCRVVSVDLCREQLRLDREVCDKYGLPIECIEADMLDLSPVYGRQFDLVYQAVSACYVPDVRKLYREIARVTRPSGYYRVEHWNPVQIQLSEEKPWTGTGYQIVRPQALRQPIPWVAADSTAGRSEATCWHYIHALSDLVGGVCDAGFNILRFAEDVRGDVSSDPGSQSHLAQYLPPFFTLFARRRLTAHQDRRRLPR